MKRRSECECLPYAQTGCARRRAAEKTEVKLTSMLARFQTWRSADLARKSPFPMLFPPVPVVGDPSGAARLLGNWNKDGMRALRSTGALHSLEYATCDRGALAIMIDCE